MRAFRTEAALESLAWLDVGQTAAKATIMTALKVLREGKQEDLVDRLARRDKRGDMKLDEESMEHKGERMAKVDATGDAREEPLI